MSNNTFDQKTKAYKENKIIQLVDNKTDQLFVDKPFRLRAFPIYVIALVLSVTCQVASGFTEMYMLFNWLSNFNIFVCIGLVAIALLIIEGAKRWGANELAINKSWFAFVILVVMQGASIFISYQGAKALPKEIVSKPVKEKPVLVDLVELENKHNSIIANKQKEIDAYWNANKKLRDDKKGYRLSSSKVVRGPYNALLDSKKILEAEKIKALDLARIGNSNLEQKASDSYDKAITGYNSKIETDSTIYGYVSLAFELLFLLAFGVMYHYLKHSDLEKQANPINERTEQNGTGERAIFTGSSDNSATHNATEQHIPLVAEKKYTPATFKDYNGVRKRPCNCCGKLYEYTRDDSKYCEAKCRSKAFRLSNKNKS